MDHFRHDGVRRVPRPVPAHRRPSTRRRLRAVPLHMHEALRSRPGTLLHRTGPQLGRHAEDDRGGAGTAHGHRHASIRRERDSRRSVHDFSQIQSCEQPIHPRLRLQPTDHAHHLPRRKQLVRMRDVDAASHLRLPVAQSRGDRRAGHLCTTRRLENRIHLGGGPRVPSAPPRPTQ